MRVLVTGHAGYIGSAMVPVLLSHGHDITGLDIGYYSDCGLALPLAAVPERQKDVREAEPGDVAHFDAVVHLAGLCNDPLGDLDAGLTDAINHQATIRLAKLARDAGVRRFVLASSCSMYGAGDGDAWLTEEAPLCPITPYAESKVRAEEDLFPLADSDFSPVYLRFATAYGLSPRLRGDVVLNNLVGWAHTTGQIRIMSDGTPWRPLVHVEDIARAVAAALEAPRETIHNQAFNIGAGEENYQVRDLAEVVRETVPGSVVEYAGVSGPDPRNYRVDFGKAQRELTAFRPEWNARRGAAQIYQALKESAVVKEVFLGPSFTRLAQIRLLRSLGMLDDDLRWAKIKETV